MTQPVVCTIVSNNYLAFARVLADSLRQHHPGIEMFVLIVDEPASSIDYAAEPFHTIFARELEIPAFEHFSFKYSLLELNTAVKPYLLAHLHARHGAEAAVYFDPDILVCADLTPLFERLAASRMVLTPHLLAPLEDDKRPSERSILLSGVYNLGFLGLRYDPETASFLAWWQRRLYSHCLHRVADGLFVDQRWMDLAPAYLSEICILRDPGYNMAYWNLPQRHLEQAADGWRVDGVPLRFFHFSGFDVDEPERISRYQDRYRLSDRPDLEPLFALYRQKVLAAGFQESRDLDYAYGRFQNGISIPPAARAELWRQDSRGERWPNPFAVGGEDSYIAWLSRPIEGAESDCDLPRLALLLWEERPDLQRAFPAPLGEDQYEYARWCLSGEPAAAGIEAAWFSALGERFRQKRLRARPAPPEPAAAEEKADVRALAFDAGYDDDERPVIPRIAMLIWQQRHDIHEAFEAPLGQSRRAFARWFATFASLEYQIPDELVAPTLHSLPLRDRLYASIWRHLASRGHVRYIPQGSWRQFVVPDTSQEVVP